MVSKLEAESEEEREELEELDESEALEDCVEKARVDLGEECELMGRRRLDSELCAVVKLVE